MTSIIPDPVCDIRNASLLTVLGAFADLNHSADDVCEFLTHNRRYLERRGIAVPSDVRINVVPTEELRLRLLTPVDLERYIASEQGDTAKIKLHVKDGLAKCVTIEFECPKKKPKPRTSSGTLNLAESMSLQDLSALVSEAEANEKAMDELLRSPRAFFEQRGLIAPVNTAFRLNDTKTLKDRLTNELAIDSFLDARAAASFEVHIKKGKGKCTKIEVTCDK